MLEVSLTRAVGTGAEAAAAAGGVERNATRALLDGTRLVVVGVEGTRRGNAGAEVLNLTFA